MKRWAIWGFAIVAFALVGSASIANDGPESDLIQGTAEQAGMSAEQLEKLTEVAQGYVEREQLAGVYTLVARNGIIVYDKPVGNRGASLEEPLAKDDLFRIYSMSKPITAVAIMQLYEKGLFKLDDPVAKFIPEFKDLKVWQDNGEHEQPHTEMTMRHLLTHTAGFHYVFGRHPLTQLYGQNRVLGSTDLEEMISKLAELPLRYHPGERWHYSVAVDVTGALVERLSGKTFDVYLKENIFEPLGMDDTFFAIPEEKSDRLLPNHSWRRQQRVNQMHPPAMESRYDDVTFFSGGGGLISTGIDYLRFAEMLRRGGELDGARILDEETLQLMVENHLPDIIATAGESAGAGENPGEESDNESRSSFGFGLGFGINTNNGEYSWGGAAGTIFWVDPVNDMVVVTMIQQMGSPWPLRNQIREAAVGAITD